MTYSCRPIILHAWPSWDSFNTSLYACTLGITLNLFWQDPITGEYILHMEPLSIIRNSEVGKRCLIANARAEIDLSRTVKHYEVERDYQINHWSLSQRWYRQRLNRLMFKRKELLEKDRLRRAREEEFYRQQRNKAMAEQSSTRKVTFLKSTLPRYGTPRAGDSSNRHFRARSAPPRSDFITSTSRAHYAFRPTQTSVDPPKMAYESKRPGSSQGSSGGVGDGQEGAGVSREKLPQFQVVWT